MCAVKFAILKYLNCGWLTNLLSSNNVIFKAFVCLATKTEKANFNRGLLHSTLLLCVLSHHMEEPSDSKHVKQFVVRKHSWRVNNLARGPKSVSPSLDCNAMQASGLYIWPRVHHCRHREPPCSLHKLVLTLPTGTDTKNKNNPPTPLQWGSCVPAKPLGTSILGQASLGNCSVCWHCSTPPMAP